MSKAVVLGGGLAGTLFARVLTEYADEVAVVDGARYPSSPGIRSGLPQAFHTHVLVAGGAQALDALLPGTVEALLAHGAHRRGLPSQTLIQSSDGWFRRHDTGAYLVSCSRWLTDHVVRHRALDGTAVSVLESTTVRGLAGDASRVTGVRVTLPDGRESVIGADLVIDATGRRSHAPRWLAALGCDAVGEEVVDSGLAYATRIYRAPDDLASTLPAIMIHPRGEKGHGATLFPIEGGRWTVTLTGTRGAAPPTDEQGFNACALGLPSPVVAELIAAAKPLGAARPFGATWNRRRYFERTRLPAGFLVAGDALVAVNPFYSHGMSIAALSALRLRRELAEGAADLQSALAEEADRSWRVATEKDRLQAGTLPAPPTDFESRVRADRAKRLLSSPSLMTEFFRSQMLLAPQACAGRPASREPDPPSSTDDAVAQYPGLADWWLSGRDPASPRAPGDDHDDR